MICMILLIGRLSHAAAIVQWGNAGGDSNIVIAQQPGLTMNRVYDEITPVHPDVGGNYYPNNTGRTPVFYGDHSNYTSGGFAGGSRYAEISNSSPGDLLQLPCYIDKGTSVQGMLTWLESDFLLPVSLITSFKIEVAARDVGEVGTLQWLVEKDNQYYISSQILAYTGTGFKAITVIASSLTWKAFTPFGTGGNAPGIASIAETTTPITLNNVTAVGFFWNTTNNTSSTADSPYFRSWATPCVRFFQVDGPLISKAYNPDPVNGANDISVNADLGWTSGPETLSYDVFFGTTWPGSFQGNQTAATFDPGTLNYGTTYYWRIDTKDASGTIPGDAWSFTTEHRYTAGYSQGCFIIGDLSGDCHVNMDDLALIAAQWMALSSCGGEAGLVAHWKLNETNGLIAVDSSASGYDGAVFGASWNPSGGMLYGALQFDGADDYVVSSFQGILGSTPRTCAAWIKTDRPCGEIMSWGNCDINAGRWVIGLDQKGVLRVDVGGGHITGTTDLADDLWHHVAVTSDGSVTDHIVLYVDGKIEAIGDVVSQTINTVQRASTKLGLFELPFQQGDYFSGLIDDARIYRRKLSLQEVWNLAMIATTNYACADLDADEIVNLSDVARLTQNWLQEAPRIIISEFLADNESKSPLGPGEILDGNGESSDWIEIHNNSGMLIDIGGCYLTDDYTLKTKWRFPTGMAQLVLQPGAYLVVFASGKTQTENSGNYPYVDPAGYLHTNFQLSKEGEYLGLFATDAVTPMHEYNHINLGDTYGYPKQEADISYGYYYNEQRYFSIPTPGTGNVRSPFEEVVEKPNVNFNGGCYVEAVDVTMTCDTPGAFIRYTTDGTVPSLTHGLEYVGPIRLESLTTLIAKAFKPGLKPSDVRIETYIFVDADVASFDSNLPIIVIDTLGVKIPIDPVNKTPAHCRTVIIDTDNLTGRASIIGPEHFTGWGQIRYRGESSYPTPTNPKGRGQFAIEIQNEYLQDNEVSLLGLPAESDWIINSEFVDLTMLKGYIAFKWFRDMGHYAPRQKFVEVYLNQDGGEIATSDYRGIFGFREKIKRNENRVNIARLDASHNLAPKVTGGYIIKNDKGDPGDVVLNLETSPTYGIIIDGATSLVEPMSLDITTSQKEWIQNYMNEFHSVLWKNTASSFYPGPHAVYTDYIDLVSWIDYFLVGETGYDVDAFRYSSFVYKDREGKLCAGPPWDFDRGFHARPYNQILPTYPDRIPWRWHQGLQQDLEYRIMLADRWFEHRKDVLNTAQNLVHIDQTVALITEAMARTIDKFGYTYNYATEITSLKSWISNRLNWLDGYIAGNFAERPPIFSSAGGYVNQGKSLFISKLGGVSGDIYYTTNGEDPRLEGGAISPNAQIYNDQGGSIIESIVSMSASVWKYLYDGTDQGTAWRTYAFDDSSWGVGPGQLGFGDDDETTDIGPKVTGRRTAYFRHKLNVSNVSQITALTITLLHDDGAVVYINDQEVSRIYMPTEAISFDTLANAKGENTTTVFNSIPLSALNEGDNIIAVEVHQNTDNSSDISFDLTLTATRSTPGSSISLSKSTCVKARVKDGNNWSALNKEVYAVDPVFESLRISELMYHPTDPNTEFIEVKNVGTEAINLNLVYFTDGIDFTFGDYTLPAGRYALIVENQTDFESKYGTGFPIAGQYTGALDNDGEEIVVRDAIGAEIHDFDYKDSWYELTDGLGFSLTMINPASTNPNDWDSKAGWRSSLYAGGTPGGEDTVLAAGSIVINELLSHSHQTQPDWIELHNTTGRDINIGGWFLSDNDSDDLNIKKYQIPNGTMIGEYSYFVFVQDQTFGNPSAPGCNIPFGLSEGGETVYLYSGSGGEVTGLYQTQQAFDAAESGFTFGRYEKAELSGGYDFVRQSSPSRGFANYGPLIPDVVITEIYYNPTSGDDYEFVELYNRSGSAVTLETEATTETSPGVFVKGNFPWRLEGTGYEFQAGVTIAPHSYILVAKNPARYSSAPCPVFGPYGGKLDNGGEEIEIQIPGDQEYGQSRYWIPIEKIDYDDTAPWPTSADGGGHSLHRINVTTYGRDYSNWSAAAPTPGN